MADLPAPLPHYGLPPLPSLPCPEFRGPTPWSNWVIRGRVLAGAPPPPVAGTTVLSFINCCTPPTLRPPTMQEPDEEVAPTKHPAHIFCAALTPTTHLPTAQARTLPAWMTTRRSAS